jgi:hypothetical protein
MCLSFKVEDPDRVLAEGEHLGFEWVVTHNWHGIRCGYVRVPKGHPWHGQDYGDFAVEVHGGLTFAEPDMQCGKGNDDAWWFGFDCCHVLDLKDPALPRNEHGEAMDVLSLMFGLDCLAAVRDQEYVEGQCKGLCQQAFDAGNLKRGLNNGQ